MQAGPSATGRISTPLIGVILAAALAVIAFPIGTVLGGRWFVAPGNGLAAPVMAMGYGVAAVGASTLLAIVLTRVATRRVIVVVTCLALAGAASSLLWIGRRWQEVQHQSRASTMPPRPATAPPPESP